MKQKPGASWETRQEKRLLKSKFKRSRRLVCIPLLCFQSFWVSAVVSCGPGRSGVVVGVPVFAWLNWWAGRVRVIVIPRPLSASRSQTPYHESYNSTLLHLSELQHPLYFLLFFKLKKNTIYRNNKPGSVVSNVASLRTKPVLWMPDNYYLWV